jgi:hypothetical protein
MSEHSNTPHTNGHIQPPQPPQIVRLKRDLREASALGLGQHEIRFLVDIYYQKQEARKAEQQQYESLKKSGEPNAFLEWVFKDSKTAEDEIKKQLDFYTDHEPTGMGLWCKSIFGIAEVITAGLLAHIDIQGLQGASSIWRYCGYDPTIKWWSKDESSKLVRAVMKELNIGEVNDDVIAHVAEQTGKHPEKLYKWAIEYSKKGTKLGTLVKKAQKQLEVTGISDEVLGLVSEWSGKPVEDLLTVTEKNSDLVHKVPTLSSLASAVSRRPWNASMKVLAFKIGDSFMKNCNRPECFYGHRYKEKRAYYERKSLAGDYRDQAAEILRVKNIGKEKKAYEYYARGELPPSHIVARAKRWTVKLFLAHFFDEWYRRHNGTEPPLPYPIAFLGHAHKIEPPPPDYYAPQVSKGEEFEDDSDWSKIDVE